MRKTIRLLTLFLVSMATTIAIVALVSIRKPNNEPPRQERVLEQQSDSAPTTKPEPKPVDPIQEQLNAMSLEEKIAQLLIVENKGQTITEAEMSRLKEAPYGGYILMGDNYGTLAGTRKFVEELQKRAKTKLIIATDQEGGLVQRIANISDRAATNIPDMYSLGSTNDAGLAQEVGRVMAEEMRAIGINVDFAPDVDVFSNPNNSVIGKRSFSDNPQVVTKMSMALARGLEENGVVATYKHFPGHGDTAVDSHLSLPVINRSRNELERSDLVPFRNAIENGAKIIMVGHIALPKVTGDNTPASLSGTIITDILRREYKYDGLVVTDAMNMGAITNNYQEWDSYRRAINAGADMLVLPSNPELAIESIKRNVKIERIDEAAYRVLKFKKENLEDYEYLDESYFGGAEHAEVVQRIR